MGWGIDFTADIYISKEYYRSAYEVEDKIKEIEIDMENIKSKIKMYSSSNIKDILPEEWIDEPINWINHQMNQLFEDYDELFYQRYRLELYLEYLNKPGNNIVPAE